MRKSIHLLRSAGYHLGLAIGSTSMPTSTALSLPSILRAHQVYAHLAAWLARADLGPTTLATYIAASREFAPALPADWPPLVLTTDPNSAYFQALSPAIAQLLHALSTRIVLPSVPVYDHVNKDKQLKGLEIAVDSLKQTMRLWPGVPGWILGLDASSPEGDEIVRRVVGEVAARAEWVSGGVSACFEYFGVPEDKKADKRSVREVVEVVRRRARPAMPEQGWKAELEVESVGRQVKEVSDDGADGW
ncbi:hypothetical protein BCR44DRAFT_40100 [Catenaria anguillulae PL171]|uniref:Uncharacterized protein n=1 Tax=Catenaria anguillulae PL171 TaxID=765915 RepID=A0A1Y2H7K5_9FUNG|nr:hypothetical protein BCR44DRAFT_40100 [Catenaria anguillulae PL171]